MFWGGWDSLLLPTASLRKKYFLKIKWNFFPNKGNQGDQEMNDLGINHRIRMFGDCLASGYPGSRDEKIQSNQSNNMYLVILGPRLV